MTLLQQARAFREAFGQETLDNISRYGFVKKKLWDLQLRLIDEEISCDTFFQIYRLLKTIFLEIFRLIHA